MSFLPSWRHVLSGATAFAMLVGVLALSAPSAQAADAEAPVLTSFSVAPRAVVPGQDVTVTYAATEAAGTLSSVEFQFQRGTVAYTAHATGAVPTSGTVHVSLPDGSANGIYSLTLVRLKDPAGNTSIAFRNGSVSYSAGATGPATHPLTLSAGDLTLTGSVPDQTSALLTSASITDSTLTVGDQVAVGYGMTEQHLLRAVTVYYQNKTANFSTSVQAAKPVDADLPTSGVVTTTVPDTWANGLYAVTSVAVVDQFGNTSSFYSDGRTLRDGFWGTHSVDLTALSFTVSGSPADFEPPVLTGLGLPTPLATFGGTVSLPYTTTDASGPLNSITATFASSSGDAFTLTNTGAPLSGTLTGPANPAPMKSIADYELSSLRITDAKGRSATYHHGGLLDLPGGSTTHSFDFSLREIRLAKAPTATTWAAVTPGPASARVQWDDAGDNGAPITGWTVTVSPSGKVVTTSGTARSATITGLTNKTRYTFTVRAKNAVGTGAGRSVLGMPRAFGLRILSPGDFDGDSKSDILAVNHDGKLLFYRGNGRGGFASTGKVIGAGWQVNRLVFPRQGPREGGLFPDVWAVSYGGTLLRYASTRNGTLSPGAPMGSGWDKYAKVFTAGDFGTDGYPDVMGITDGGDLYYYPHRWQTGGFYPGVRIGGGWQAFTQVFGAGDQTGDGRNDLMAIKSDGTLWLYAGNGKGGFAAAGKRIGSGWGSVRAAFITDFDGGGPDLLTVDAKGDLRLYRGNNRAGFSYRGVIGKGWNIFL
ncbi:fibronectin type III domain-containing protein [Pedococcus sp. P5_B7]